MEDTSKSSLDVLDVSVHPLVLLSAADHYHRVARGTRKRVVGVLLGQVVKGKVEATNSFAVPFEEDSRNPVGILGFVVWPSCLPFLCTYPACAFLCFV